MYQMLVDTGRIGAFDLNFERPVPSPIVQIFGDSDPAKWLEAASYALVNQEDPALAALVDQVADKIIAAQQPDGYLNTHFIVTQPEMRWKNLRDWHEMYCAGHLMEAAVAPVMRSRSLVVVVRSTSWLWNDSLVAVTVQVVDPNLGTEAAAQDWARLTPPCFGTNATGRCNAPAPVWNRTSANCWLSTGALDSIVIWNVALWPGERIRLDGWNRIFVSAGTVDRGVTRSVFEVTFVTVRLVVTRPGIVGALIDGMLRSIVCSGSPVSAAKLVAVSEIVSGARIAGPTATRPAPMSNGSAGVVSSSLTTAVVDRVIMADLIWPGSQPGCSALSRIATPAMCGEDIEVPAIAW